MVRYFARGQSLPVMLAARRWLIQRPFGRAFLWLILAFPLALAGSVRETAADIILIAETSSEILASGDNMSSVPATPTSVEKNQQTVSNTPHDALPLGTGASGGTTNSTFIFAVVDHPLSELCPPALSSALDERRISIPAFPVFDRLRPPRIG